MLDRFIGAYLFQPAAFDYSSDTCRNGCAYCLSPETLIQYADGTARKISSVSVGDSLIGINKRNPPRQGWNYKFAVSRVLAKFTTIKPVIRITLENGLWADCSGEHKWLTDRGWKKTDRLTLNNAIRFLSYPVKTPEISEAYRQGYLAGIIRGDAALGRYDYSGKTRAAVRKEDVHYHFRLAMKDESALIRAASYLKYFGVSVTWFDFSSTMRAIRTSNAHAFDAIVKLITYPDYVHYYRDSPRAIEWTRGWLAGIFDAEGGNTSAIRIYNTDPEIIKITERAFLSHGFNTTRDKEKSNGCMTIRLLGGRSEATRFFNRTMPALQRKLQIEGTTLQGSSRIKEIKPLGKEIEMIDITTTTENFIAGGMVSHNCFANINQAERKGNLQGAIKKFYKTEITTYNDMLLRDGYPICISNRTDPFTARNWRDTVALCQHLVNIPNGVYIQTKCGPGMNEALGILGDKKPVVYITITTLRDDIAAVLEPNAPPPSERLRIAKDLHRRGYLVLIAVNPCAEQWMPHSDLEALCNDLKASGIRHVVIEMLDMSRNRIKILPQSRIDRMGAAALEDCRSGRVRGYVRECTEYLVGAGMIVCKKGMPFRSSFFDDIKVCLGKTMPTIQDFVNYCFDTKGEAGAVTFAEFDQVIRGGRGGVFDMTFKGSAIRDYLLRAGFVSWKANQSVPTHHDLLRIVWNDPRHRISIQKHCLFKPTNKKDPEGNAVLWFDGKADLGVKKEVITL